MNLELLESYGQNYTYPEEFDGILDSTNNTLAASFNRRGSLLATGCNDGRIVIWDFLTRRSAKVLLAHTSSICSVCWNRKGNKLVTAGTDHQVAIWNVLTSECEHSFRFPGPVSAAYFNPRNDKQVLVCPLKQPPLVVETNGERFALPCVEDGDTSVCASFDRRGRCVYAGNSKGKVFIICAKKFKLLKAFKIGNSSQGVKQIKFARKGGCFLVNSVDRVIRVYDSEQIVSDYSIPEGEAPCVSTIEPIQRLQDLVNRTLWKTCVFSGDGMFVCAGSAKQHQIYIWEKATETKAVSQTQLVKILEGTRGEQLLDVVWHPVRPIVVSVSNGMISVWSRNQVENWSAFAPEFTELDENVEYDEKESEFDEEDEDKSLPPDEAELFQDIEIDVEKVEKIEAFFSSDEEDFDDGCIYIPVAPDVDDPEDNPALPIKDCTEVDLTKKKSTKRKKSSKIGRPKKTR